MIQGFDHDIINVNFNNFADQLMKDIIHGSLISCTGIFQPKCHDYLLTQNVHLAPSTQQAEQAGFTRAKSHKTCQSIFPEN
jgi:hypothetical protein